MLKFTRVYIQTCFYLKKINNLIINNQNAKVKRGNPFYSESIFESWSESGNDSDSVKFMKCLKKLNVPVRFTSSIGLYGDI